MTKKEFESTDEPVVMIVSLNPKTGKVLYDTYDWRTADSWIEDFKKDFPDMLHFFKYSPAAIRARKKAFGFPEKIVDPPI